MKCLFAAAAGALLLAGTATPASSAVTVLGKNAARSCYEAARDSRTSTPALQFCNEALAQQDLAFHDVVATHVNRGIIHMLRNENADAMRDFDRAIALDPDEPESYLNKGILLLRTQSRSAEALALVNTAIAKKTKGEAVAYYMRGVANEDNGNISAAYRDYQRAAQLAPKWALPAEELKRFVVRRRG